MGQTPHQTAFAMDVRKVIQSLLFLFSPPCYGKLICARGNGQQKRQVFPFFLLRATLVETVRAVEKNDEWVGGRQKKCQMVGRRHQFSPSRLKNKVAKFGEIAGLRSGRSECTWLFASEWRKHKYRKFETRPEY